MSTDRQIAANRQNARKSRGPKTESGKAASSGNARRHGLTGALGVNLVLSWYRVIVEDERAVPDPFERDPYLLAAMDLARAEANLQRVRQAEERWLLGPKAALTKSEKALAKARDLLDTLLHDALLGRRLRVVGEGRFLRVPFRGRADIEGLCDMLEEQAQDRTVRIGWDRKGSALLRRIDGMIERDCTKGQMQHEKLGRSLARYRASAEARRRTALRRWIEQVAKRRPPQRGAPE